MADGQYVYKMKLTGGVTDYDATTRAATTKTWKEGDVLYLRFPGETTTLGIATFDGSQWELKTDASIVGSGNCTAVSIDGGTMVSDNSIGISPFNAIYEGKDCAWSFSNDVLMVHANLNPLVGRLRLRGAEETVVSVTGLSTYTSFDRSTGQFTNTKSAVKTFIQSDRYTPYIYGILSDTSSPQLNVNGYVMECPSTMMKAGQSGWLNLPTDNNHAGWTTDGNGTSVDAHEYVDLGLSVKWATCNVGASSPEDYGDYYAWGETETKSKYDWSTYKWCTGTSTSMTKYCTRSQNGIVDNKTELDPEDDVAHVKWGGKWRMPTRDEVYELCNKCKWTWMSKSGHEGYIVTSPNGNSIFLPAAGYCDDTYSNHVGEFGYYWTSYLSWLDTSGSILFFGSSRHEWSTEERRYGHSVRPVCQ